jgi:hypothetical protein
MYSRITVSSRPAVETKNPAEPGGLPWGLVLARRLGLLYTRLSPVRAVPEQWGRLAEFARQEIVAGDTIPLDEAFPAEETEW